MTLKRVVFPAPFGPMTPLISPSSTSISSSLIAANPPKFLLKLLTSNIAISASSPSLSEVDNDLNSNNSAFPRQSCKAFNSYPACLQGSLEAPGRHWSNNGLFRSCRLLSLRLHSLSVSKQAGKLRDQTLEPTRHKYQKADQDSAKE